MRALSFVFCFVLILAIVNIFVLTGVCASIGPYFAYKLVYSSWNKIVLFLMYIFVNIFISCTSFLSLFLNKVAMNLWYVVERCFR